MIWLYIAAGGAAGALARYGLGGWVQAWGGASFPWGTFAVNAVGCFGLGLAVRLLEAAALPAELRALATVGFFGAFTTFSTFSYEALLLMRDGAWGRAAAYVGASVVLGLAAVAAGMGAGRALA